MFFSLGIQPLQAGMVWYGVRGLAEVVWVVGKAGYKHAAPLVKEAAQKIRPTVQKISSDPQVREAAQLTKEWIKANPKHAGAIGLGAFVGYKTSGDGVIKTTIGTGLGAAAGASLYLNYLRLAAAKDFVLATESVAVVEAEVALFKEKLALGQKAISNFIGQRDLAKKLAMNSRAALQELMARKAVQAPLSRASVFNAAHKQNFASTFNTFKTLLSLRTATPVAAGTRVNALELAVLGA